MNTPAARFDLTFIIVGIPNLTTIKPKNMVEIGSRDGYDTNLVANHFGIDHGNCFVFEPNIDSCTEIVKNYPNFNTFNNAVSSEAITKEFYIDDSNIGMCSLLKSVEKDLPSVQVDCIDMKSLIDNMNLSSIDICKIDVEGAALDVLKSFGDKLNIVKSIQLEAETQISWKDQSLYSDIKMYLKDNNFIEILFCRLSDSQIEAFWVKEEYLICHE